MLVLAVAFWQSTPGDVAQGVIYTLLAAFVVAIVRATMKTYGKHQEQNHDDQGLREFFFDTPANERTGVPGRKGWTTKVDATLQTLTAGQARTDGQLSEVLAELREDGNGGHNFRGEVKRAVEERP